MLRKDPEAAESSSAMASPRRRRTLPAIPISPKAFADCHDGAAAFYKGDIATSHPRAPRNALGGTMSADDLAEFTPEWVDPSPPLIANGPSTNFRPTARAWPRSRCSTSWRPLPLRTDGPLSVAELHKKIEAMKLAYADLERYNADPRFAKVPVQGLLSKDYAKERAKLIDPRPGQLRLPRRHAAHSDTTYLTAVDREGNIVSLIQSNYCSFGSGITVRGMGFVLQNRGALFSLDPAQPNALAPRKRPFHTIIPAFMEHGDQHIGFGIMGGAEPAPGSRAVRLQHGGLRHEHPGRARERRASPSAQFDLGCNILIEDRVPADSPPATHHHGTSSRGPRRILHGHGPRSGHRSQHEIR